MTMLKNCAMKTVNDLIAELQKLDPRQKSLPFVVYDSEHNQEYQLNGLDISSEDRIYLNLMF
jgi:hypothetical protein